MNTERFAHVVSHDLKGSLEGIQSMVGFFVEDYADRLDETGLEQLRLIQRMASRGTAMVQALRDYARVANLDMVRMTCDPGVVAAQAVSASRASASCDDVQFSLQENFPMVAADSRLLLTVFDRLVANAVLFNDARPRQVHIGHGVGTPPRPLPTPVCVVHVRDNGIGIAPSDHQRVFEMFYRPHLPEAFGGGVGGGLAVAEKAVERLGGTIWLESTAGEGTTFFVALPLATGASS